MQKPTSEAALRNRGPILERLRELLETPADVLELGAGTGQHAAYFTAHLPHLRWQPSDLAENLETIRAWLRDEGGPNAQPPVAIDLCDTEWGVGRFDVVYSANTVHYVAWEAVEAMFRGLEAVLRESAMLILYGPFKYGGEFTTPSNEAFDAWLKARNPGAGVRDIEVIDRMAARLGLALERDIEMPANNQLLVWRR